MSEVEAPDPDGSAVRRPERLASSRLLLDEPVPGVARSRSRIPTSATRSTTSCSTRWPGRSAASTRAACCSPGRARCSRPATTSATSRIPSASPARPSGSLPTLSTKRSRHSSATPTRSSRRSTAAIGGGLELAVTADLRLAVRGAKLGMPPARLGLVYSYTGLRRFVETCGLPATNELFHVGRNVDADRALAIGLVNHVVEPGELEERSVSLAAEIAANAPLSLAGNKRILRALREHPGVLPEDLERELVELRESCFDTEDFREGVAAFAQKRAPEWKGR